jgi:O-antigen/teichoic acid export membrane protein
MFHFRVYVSATIALRRDTAGLKLRDKEEGKKVVSKSPFILHPRWVMCLLSLILLLIGFQAFLLTLQNKRMMMGGTRIVVLILAMMAVDRAKHTHEN